MNVKSSSISCRFVGVLLCAAVLFAACSRAQHKNPSPHPPTTATVTYFTGSVTITVGSNTRSADLGQEVPVDATVSTGDNSQCDLQFGSLGTLRVQADTKVSLDQISVGAERRISSMKLLEGAVAAKVSKLAGSDRFNVTTNSVVCGVRGTEFIVRTAGDGGTTVSVKEGRVALLPPAFDPAPLESGAAGTSAAPLVDKAFSTLQEMVPAVGASQTVTVGAHDLDKASDAWKKVETKLNDLTAKTQAAGDRGAQTPTSPGDTAAALDAAGLKTTIASVASASETLAAKTETVTTAKAHELDAFDTMTILAILGPSQAAAGSGTTSGGTSQAPTEPAAALLVPISITCEPTDAEILVEGKSVGIGTAFMLEPQGSVIHLLVNRGGYESYQEEIHAEAKTGEKRTVVLKAITSSTTSSSHIQSQTLAAPLPLSPISGQKIDINKSATLWLSWDGVPGAAKYEVSLYQGTAKAGQAVQSWTTSETSISLNQFSGLSLGDFVWEIVAVGGPDGTMKSPPVDSSFQLVKGMTLNAPSVQLPQD